MKRFTILVAIGAAACGGDNKSTAAPSNTTTTITVTLADTVPMGQNTQASAVATLSNGSTQPVATGWRSDTSNVATVTDGGLVTGGSSGRANIFVISGGRQGTKQIRVVPDYQGNWAGRWTVANCVHTGVFAEIDACSEAPIGTAAPISTALTQTGLTVKGHVMFGDLNTGSISAPIASDNAVTFTGRINGDDDLYIDTQTRMVSEHLAEMNVGVRLTFHFTGQTGDMVLTGQTNSPAIRTASVIGTLSINPKPHGFHNTLRAVLGY